MTTNSMLAPPQGGARSLRAVALSGVLAACDEADGPRRPLASAPTRRPVPRGASGRLADACSAESWRRSAPASSCGPSSGTGK